MLADLCGKPMLWHVFQGVSQASTISEVVVLTDSAEVFEEASSWGARTLMTSEDCPSGTDRIASALDQLEGDVIVNVQGDEPLISGSVVDQLVEAHEHTHGQADVATPVYRITTTEELASPNVVKVVRAADGSVLYFSRSSIPHVRDFQQDDWLAHSRFWGHAGLYAYTRDVLKEFPRLPEGKLERVEKLEQLRLLEAGKRFLAVEIEYRPRAVDVPSDLDEVRRILERSGQGTANL